MKKSLFWIEIFALLAMVGSGYGQGDLRRFEIQSKAVGVRYTIEVMLPSGATGSGSKYPVVYCTDWFVLSEYLRSLPKLMDLGRLTEPFVVVGISQQRNAEDWATARTRDFTPSRPTDEYSKNNTYSKAAELTGGALRFVTFLKDELLPYVESVYPVDPARRGFIGYSLGGLLGVYILVKEPKLCHYFLLGSPSVWFNDYSLAFELEKTPAKHLESIRGVYLSVGEEESWQMLKGFGILKDALSSRDFKGSRAKIEIIKEAGHVGAMPIALYNGLRFLFHRK
jgi:predicted alpha/beta superfamily hydrolase